MNKKLGTQNQIEALELSQIFLTNSVLETRFLMGVKKKKLRTVFHSGNTKRRAYRLFHKLHTCRLKLLPGHSPGMRLPSTMKPLVSSKIASSNSWNLEWKNDDLCPKDPQES